MRAGAGCAIVLMSLLLCAGVLWLLGKVFTVIMEW